VSRIFGAAGGTFGSRLKYAAKGSVEMSKRDSERWASVLSFAPDEVDGSVVLEEDAVGSEAGFAVRNEGSNSRVLSSVLGTFCASRR
jgi:hypothetical protein